MQDLTHTTAHLQEYGARPKTPRNLLCLGSLSINNYQAYIMYRICVLALFAFASCSPTNNDQPKVEQKSVATQPTKKATDDLTKHGIADHPNNVLGGLKVGDLAPDIELEDERGNLVSLDKSLKDGPVILVFYRADWCSICRKHLAEFEDKINEIKASGIASVIAISPQKQQYSLALHKKNNYTFPILFDESHQTMKDYKVFFHVTDKYNEYITEEKGDPIEFRNGNKEPVMPVPATYLIGQDKRIKYVHYDPNYRVRANIDEALKSIRL